MAPSAPVLFNYDTDFDGAPGRLIQKGGSGADETDIARHQVWRTPALTADFTVQGTVQAELWAAIKDFTTGKQGLATVYVRDYSGGSATTIAQGSFTLPGVVAAWVPTTVTMNVGSYTIVTGHSLELKVIVSTSSEDDMWFAYDTSAYPSRVAGY